MMRVSQQMILKQRRSRRRSGLWIKKLGEDNSSGIRVQRMSADPAAEGEAVWVSSSLRAIDRVHQNTQLAVTRGTAEGSSIDRPTNARARSAELAVAQASGTGNVQTLMGTRGARANEFDKARPNRDSLELTLTTCRYALRDTNVEKARAELVGKQTLQRVVMGATSKTPSLSLAHFISPSGTGTRSRPASCTRQSPEYLRLPC